MPKPSTTGTGPPTDFKISSGLSQFQIPVSKFLETFPEFDGVASGIFVFHQDKLLLIQRSAHDSMPNRWETPGGACDPDDATILHAAARELWEETGLHVQRVIRSVGDGFSFKTSRGLKVRKVSFEVDVEEADADEQNTSNQAYPSAKNLTVKLDPKEHQNSVWASEDDVKTGKSGNIALIFTHENQRQVTLEAFESRKRS